MNCIHNWFYPVSRVSASFVIRTQWNGSYWMRPDPGVTQWGIYTSELACTNQLVILLPDMADISGEKAGILKEHHWLTRNHVNL